MANEIGIVVGASETASDVIVGVGKSAQRAEKVIVQSMGSTEDAFDTAARGASKFGDVLDKSEGFTGKLADGVDGLGQATQSVSDLMSHGARKAEDLARAQQDVEQAAQDAAQAVEDLNQANRDSAQAGIDAEQAAIDQKQALIDQAKAENDLRDARKEGDPEAIAQAENDIKQAKLDGKQATEDAAQAERDAAQAHLDGKQALIDQKTAATDLTAAQRDLASQSSILGKISDWSSMLSGVLSGLVGVIGTITAVQWAWNVAMTANPIGIIIVAIGVLIGVIVLIATKTTWFQTLWKAIWSKIGDPVKATWKWIKDTTQNLWNWFGSIFKQLPKMLQAAWANLANFMTLPFRTAFNFIAWAWNNTVGRLSFTIPDWVPDIGGASFSMPRIPSLDVGTDEVMKTGLAMIHKGEKITPAEAAPYTGDMRGAMGHAEPMEIRIILEWDDSNVDSRFMSIVNEGIRAYVGTRQGNVQLAYGRGRVS